MLFFVKKTMILDWKIYPCSFWSASLSVPEDTLAHDYRYSHDLVAIRKDAVNEGERRRNERSRRRADIGVVRRCTLNFNERIAFVR